MFLDIAQVVLGLAGLFIGGQWLVVGASRFSASLGISPLVIGITVVAFGTSMPELLVNVSAALGGSTDIAIGNVVGSNVANIALILGVAGLIYPMTVHITLIRREIPLMIAISLFAAALMFDGVLTRVDGGALFAGIITFTLFMYWQTTRDMALNGAAEMPVDLEIDLGGEIKQSREVARMLAGIVALSVGAQFMVGGATGVARTIGVSELVISVTLVALGTSLPELAASVAAAFHKENDIVIGNVVGSNIFNLLSILGITALVMPIPVPEASISLQIPLMLFVSVLLFPFVLNRRFERFEATLFLAAYVIFIMLTFTA